MNTQNILLKKAHWGGTIESLAERSKRPHHHPNEHIPDELKLIRDVRRRSPQFGKTELWHRLFKRGYTRRRLPRKALLTRLCAYARVVGRCPTPRFLLEAKRKRKTVALRAELQTETRSTNPNLPHKYQKVSIKQKTAVPKLCRFFCFR